VYKRFEMPNQRAQNQTLIAFACDRDLLRLVDEARSALGEDRSVFVRGAIVRELQRRGHRANPKWVNAPDRAKLVRYPPLRVTAEMMTGKPTNSTTAHASHLAKIAAKVKPVSYRRRALKKSATAKHPAPVARETL
jgi:hypothetical protein